MAALVVAGVPAPVTGGADGACALPGTVLLAARGDDVVLVDPVTDLVHHTPLTVPIVERTAAIRALPRELAVSPWIVTRTSDESGLRVRVEESASGAVVFDLAFPRRIELAASAVSPAGRYTVIVQANNIATEVVILDAATGARHDARIRHDAPLAAWAIGIDFAPAGGCVAVAMEWTAATGTWLVHLENGEVEAVPGDVFALDWVRTQARPTG